MPNIATEKHTLAVADGSSMQAFVARPEEKGTFPGMLVFQEAFGVNAHIRDVTQRIAREGYVAIAPELFHRSATPGFEGRYNDFPSVMTHMKTLTEQGLADDVRASYEWFRDSTHVVPNCIGSIGFCMGGRVAVPRQCHRCVARRNFVLRRRYRPSLASARDESAGSDAVLLGRARQAYPAGPGSLRYRCRKS